MYVQYEYMEICWRVSNGQGASAHRLVRAQSGVKGVLTG